MHPIGKIQQINKSSSFFKTLDTRRQKQNVKEKTFASCLLFYCGLSSSSAAEVIFSLQEKTRLQWWICRVEAQTSASPHVSFHVRWGERGDGGRSPSRDGLGTRERGERSGAINWGQLMMLWGAERVMLMVMRGAGLVWWWKTPRWLTAVHIQLFIDIHNDTVANNALSPSPRLLAPVKSMQPHQFQYKRSDLKQLRGNTTTWKLHLEQ